MVENNEIVIKRNYIFDENKVKSIINEFCKVFTSKKATIQKAIEADFKVDRIKLDYNNFLKQLDNIKKISVSIFNRNLTNTVTTGIGDIAVMFDGCSYVTLDFVLKALLTHNNLYLFSSDYMLATNTVIITLINDILKKYNYGASIKHLQAKTDLFREAVLNQDKFDLLVYVGDKYEFKKIKNDFNKPVILKEYGHVFVYAEPTEEIKQTLLKMDHYAYDNNINLEYLTGDNLEEIINKINEISTNDTVALFTKNSDKAFELISRINTEKIFINKSPFEDYIFNFDARLLTLEKKLIY